MKYQTKPCQVEAIQWNGNNLEEVFNFTNEKAYTKDGYLYIHTLEGDMKALNSDYIIKGLKGEYYPCRKDIFEIKYEKVK